MNQPEITEGRIKDTLRENIIDQTYDLNIVDLGTVHNVEIGGEGIGIDFSPPSPDDPKTGSMAGKIEQVLRDKFDTEVEVNFITEPKWSPDMMTDEAREEFLN